MLNFIEHVEKYCDLGWALTPIDGKAPKSPGWQRTTPQKYEDVVAVWTGWGMQGMNIGLVLGQSNVADFELDSDDVEAFLGLLGGSIPQTPAFKTGTGKFHVLFQAEPGMTRYQTSGMELRAGPHQSVLPPSIHPGTGKPYEWIPGHEPWNVKLLPIPKKVWDFFIGAPGQSGAVTSFRDALGRDGKLGEGEGRHSSLISYLGKSVNIFDTVEQLIEAAITFAQLTQDPPYADDIIEFHARDAWNRYRVEGEAPPPPDDDETVEERLKVRRLSDVKARNIEFLWKPFLQKSAFHLLAGQKGAGKGSLLTLWAANITVGEMGDRPRSVLWVGTEDSAEIDIRPRFQAQGGDLDRMFFIGPEAGLHLPRDTPHLQKFMAAYDVGMLVIDPLVAVIGDADTNSEGPIVQAIGGLNALADAQDCLVIGVRHLGKNTDRGALAAVLGGVAWVNTPRVVLGLARDDAGSVILEVLAGNRTKHNASYEYRIDTAVVPPLTEEVTKIVPVGPASKGVEEVSGGKAGDHVNWEAVRPFIELRLAEQNQDFNKLLRSCVSSLGTNRSTFQRIVDEMKEEGLVKFYKSLDDRWMLEAIS